MPYTDKCLGPSGANLLDKNDVLTKEARDAFTLQVIALLTSGNKDGKGAKISSVFGIPFPPRSGVLLPDPDRLLTNPDDLNGDLFWFDPSPMAPLSYSALRDPNGGYQKVIVDGLYQPIVRAMNLAGNAAAPPIVDYTGLLPPEVAIKVKLENLPKAVVAIPQGAIALAAALKIDVDDAGKLLLSLKDLVPTPAVPSVPVPPLPSHDFVVFDDLFLALVTLPLKLLPGLVAELAGDPIKVLTPSFDALLSKVVLSIFKPFLQILKEIGLLTILPKLLSATVIVILQSVVVALIPVLVSQIIGTGVVVKTLGDLTRSVVV